MDQITVLMVSAGVDSTNQGLKMFGEKKIIPEMKNMILKMKT